MQERTVLGRRLWGHGSKESKVSGRRWLHWGSTTVGFEWAFWREAKLCIAMISLPIEEKSIVVSIGIPWLFSLHLWLEASGLGRKYPKYKRGRTVGMRIFANKIWLSLWDDPMASNHDDPWWWAITIAPLDILFGKSKSTKSFIRGYTIEVPMPEDTYGAAVNVYEYIFKRPRWPFRYRRLVSCVDMTNPLPVPGKGTCSYNIGEDAIHSLSTHKQRPHEVIAVVVSSAMRDRLRYGGDKWIPAEALS